MRTRWQAGRSGRLAQRSPMCLAPMRSGPGPRCHASSAQGSRSIPKPVDDQDEVDEPEDRQSLKGRVRRGPLLGALLWTMLVAGPIWVVLNAIVRIRLARGFPPALCDMGRRWSGDRLLRLPRCAWFLRRALARPPRGRHPRPAWPRDTVGAIGPFSPDKVGKQGVLGCEPGRIGVREAKLRERVGQAT
jgi:hypothetical protein